MSRSYRKPWHVDTYGSKYKKREKRVASKKVRRTKNIADGRMFSKVYNPYNIVDWKCFIDTKGWWFQGFFHTEPEFMPGTPKWKAIRK